MTRGRGESKLGAKRPVSCIPTFSHETNYSIGNLPPQGLDR